VDDERLAGFVPEGEGLRYVDDLRPGGAVGFTDERLLVARDDQEPTSVALDSVESVEFQDYEWFEAFLGVVLLAFGLASASRSVLLATLFVVLALASLLLTYRKRGKATVSVHSRAKPLTLYPGDGQGFYDAFERALDDYRERLRGGDAPLVVE
jgi:hypothetical protein